MALVLVTAAEESPVTIHDLRTQLRIDDAAEDPYLALCLERAQAYLAEGSGWTGVACLTSTWDFGLDAFPCGWTLRDRAIRLPLRPVQSVTSVTYTDTAGNAQVLSPSLYAVHLAEDPGPALIVPAYGQSWPPTRVVLNAVTVRFVAGWRGRAAVSGNVTTALLLLAAHFYVHRDTDAPVPVELLGQLLANERVYA